ncbi:MAG: GIY-YIG nuclease family protein [Parcubacteria group bacterium]|jgi:putative endonuclease
MYYVYILLSLRDDKFYIGYTGNLKKRIQQHGNGKVESTSKRLPIKLIYYECYAIKEDARRNEKYYKTTKGRDALRKKLKDILSKYSS